MRPGGCLAWAAGAAAARGERGRTLAIRPCRTRSRNEPPHGRFPGAASALVRLRGASVYLDYRPVLRGLAFSQPGECWVVHGANGAGKTTLLRAIYGDHPVAAGGRMRRRGMAPGVPLSEFRRRCAIVAPHLQADYPRETRVLEVVVSGLRASIGLDEPVHAEELAAARAALRDFGIARGASAWRSRRSPTARRGA